MQLLLQLLLKINAVFSILVQPAKTFPSVSMRN